MSDIADTTVHASAIQIGGRAALITGPSGSGKSRLVFDLVLAGKAGLIERAALIGDDRLHLAVRQGTLFARPAPELAGLIEIRGLGIRRCAHVAEAAIDLLIELAAADGARMPVPAAFRTSLMGVELRRIPIAADFAALPLVLAEFTTTDDYAG